jgi:hypothetical protein
MLIETVTSIYRGWMHGLTKVEATHVAIPTDGRSDEEEHWGKSTANSLKDGRPKRQILFISPVGAARNA